MFDDEHFLQRSVERLSCPAMERAMLLYNDSELVRFLLAEAKLPADDRDVAIALGPGEKPAHTIVRRDGRCRTNLSGDQPYRDAHPLSFSRFEALLERHGEVLSRFAAAERLTGEKGSAGQLLLRLIERGRYLSREEFVAASYWQPLLRDVLVSLFRFSAKQLERQRQVVRRHPTARLVQHHQPLLRRYWSNYFFLGHCALLAVMERHQTGSALELPAEEVYDTVANGLLWLGGTLGALLRAAWVAGELGGDILGVVKRRFRHAVARDDRWTIVAEATTLLAIAARRSGTRAEIQKGIAAPLRLLADSSDSYAVQVHDILRSAFDSLDAMSMENGLMWLGLAHDLYEHQQAHAEATPLQLREPVQVVSPDVATMAVANATYRLTGLNGFRLAVLTLRHAVKQEAHQLYFPEETLRQLRRPWVAADTLAILETQEAAIGKPQPVRRQATPGRNDPCYCGSGQKYKRCCAGTGDDGGASL